MESRPVTVGDVVVLVVVGGALGHAMYSGYKYLCSLGDRDNQFPTDTMYYHHPFSEPLDAGCHISANGVFSLLTGISCKELDVLGYSHGRYDFDKPYKDSKMVFYMGLTWQDWSIDIRGKKISKFHALVYYDGYLYQSYRTTRDWWGLPATDSYPFIRMKLKKEDRDIFEKDTSLLTVAVFNRLCAPSCHPIASDVTLRCVSLYRAYVNPTRREVTLTRDLENDE